MGLAVDGFVDFGVDFVLLLFTVLFLFVVLFGVDFVEETGGVERWITTGDSIFRLETFSGTGLEHSFSVM